jgi:hypothetical protein
MELLIPGLAFLLIGVAIAFFVVPKIAPAMLLTGSAAAIVLSLYLHINKFGNEEYNRSTWQNNFKLYARMAIIGAVIFGAYIFYAMNTGAPMPPISMPKVGGGDFSILDTVSSRVGELLKKGRISLD